MEWKDGAAQGQIADGKSDVWRWKDRNRKAQNEGSCAASKVTFLSGISAWLR